MALWFYFPGRGYYELSGIAEKELVATGAHGYTTKAQAGKHPNATSGFEWNFVQAPLLDSFDAASLSPGGAGATGILVGPHGTGGVTGAVNNLTGLGALGDAANRLTQPNFWERAIEVIAGLILLYVGLNALARDTPVQSTTQYLNQGAKKAGQTLRIIPK